MVDGSLNLAAVGVGDLYAADIAYQIFQTFHHRNRLWLFGVGGSSSNASHIASEFVSHWTGVALPAVALVTDPAVITAIANDYGFDAIFERQLKAHARPGDFVIALSTDGNALSVRQGLCWAKANGLVTSAWTGAQGQSFAHLSKYPVIINRTWTATIQEYHLALGHLISDLVCERFKNG